MRIVSAPGHTGLDVGSEPSPWGGCRLHGRRCRLPWGFDRAHTDSPRPYTDQELADRPEPPHRHAYSSHKAYLEGHHLWRVMRRDARLNPAEADVVLACRAERAGFTGRTLDDVLAELRERL